MSSLAGQFRPRFKQETPDVWHAITGFGADLAGEGGLQAFYLAQLPARLGAAIISVGLLNTMIDAFEGEGRSPATVDFGRARSFAQRRPQFTKSDAARERLLPAA